MALKSVNPVTGQEVACFEELSEEEVLVAIEKGREAYLDWREVSFEERGRLMCKVAEVLRRNARKYAALMTLEMGKPITQALSEVEKCAWVCDFYAENAEGFLASEEVKTDAGESFVQYDPLGIVLAVMPWNYPFWQVFRALAPTLMAGNVMLLKHASNVPQCGMAILEVCREAGVPFGVFQNLPIGSAKVQAIIEDDRVAAATLTGSEYAGSKVGEACGREIKPVVLELGGSGPFMVFEDADVEEAARVAVSARFLNCGQSCIASKRFIVMEGVYERFLEGFREELASWKVGDPSDPEVKIGPLYGEGGCEDIERQVNGSKEMGARVVYGGKRGEGAGAFFEPTILADVSLEMPVMKEETFGPVAAVMKVSSEKEALFVANSTRFGLGASVWTKDVEKAKRLSSQLDFGAVFVNGLVKSDPRLPFGGVKKSGIGRELAIQGIRAFVNVKTVWIK